MYLQKSDDFLFTGRWGDFNGKTRSPRRETSPTSPGCHRNLDRDSETGEKKYTKRLLKNPLPDRLCQRSWSSSHRPRSHLVRAQPRPVPGSPRLRRRCCRALTPGDEAAAPRGAGGGRCTPRGARLMLCSTCPHQGTPQPPHAEKMRCCRLPP